MHRIKLAEAETCLAELVKEAANGEEVIITQEDGIAIKLTRIADSSDNNKNKLVDPEGIWDHSVTSQNISDARKEMWKKFDSEDSE